MLEHKQKFFLMECEMCGREKTKWDREWIIERRFVTCADNPNKAVCTNCGFTTSITDKKLQAQLNKQEVIQNGKVI